jgi:peptidoglycan/xylan/chitin deacetylase (PgdA/CDA1 family)
MQKLLKKIAAVLLTAGIAAFICFWIFPLPGHIPVLMYHFTGTEQDAAIEKNYVSQQNLEHQMAMLKKFGFRVISVKEYEAIRAGRQKPRGREAVITFDDGHFSFESLALPVFKKYRYPVTLFLISDWLKRGTKETGSMTPELIKELDAENPWIDLGSHTLTHPVLPELSEEAMRKEVIQSKKNLEAEFGIPMDYFAYPIGAFDERTIQAVKDAGYRLAFTTGPNKLNGGSETDYSLTRIKMSAESDNPFVFWFKLSGLYHFFKIERAKIAKYLSHCFQMA